MSQLDSKEVYLYGMMFSLVNDNLKVLEKCRYNKPSVWGKVRFTSREMKIEKILREILKRKIDKGTDGKGFGELLIDDLSHVNSENPQIKVSCLG